MLWRSVDGGTDVPACRTDGVQQAAVQGMGVRRSPHDGERGTSELEEVPVLVLQVTSAPAAIFRTVLGPRAVGRMA
jgi:hypothetical protein